jgi:type I restriction enzyme M protein
MLDLNTKRKLDSARQILVGKVPDPKAQVEQITTALIYKFMDDMDKESEELGGEAKFFANGFSQYAWTKLLDNKLFGQERLDLYVQAISNMSKNPHIPQLFRDIFKGAFLPYNDPRTLSLFLKEINEFSYEHSENLGNAFEYLLSILGSQGDAGQFRTPRHIIDFIVEVVDPKKNETILDPACGTAGFLISAYKHILKTNKEKPLTPEEKLKLMNNISGYDISPDMVKLALVNMYLHGFPDPKIHEYDSLTSEKRWDETFDVILANPPFMTPKGGIVPHKRFSIQASRAEVLFVDYIVEHLTIKGRAGIIVPEGIIFQSNKAYTQLRKKLVEDGLFAVVSLPSGVFQPYSGVKTSILIFDKELTEGTKNILFVKIQNDGFDLGAQRREIDKNDLPLALGIIKKFKSTLSESDFNEDEKQLAHVVAKEKIIKSGDYNLSGERYKELVSFAHQKWPMVELGEVLKESKLPDEEKNIYKRLTVALWHKGVLKREIKEDIVNKREGTTYYKRLKGQFIYGKQNIVRGAFGIIPDELDGYCSSSDVPSFDINSVKVIPKFLDAILLKNYEHFKKLETGAGSKRVSVEKFLSFKIPLPPLEVQKEIVEQIEVKQKAIDHAKAIIESLEKERRYFGHALRKLEGVEWVELGEVAEVIGGFAFKSENLTKEIKPKYLPVIKIGNIGRDGKVDVRETDYHEFTNKLKKFLIMKNDILVAMTGATVGKIAISDNDHLLLNQRVGLIRSKSNVLEEYLKHLLLSYNFYEFCQKTAGGGAQGNISPSQILNYKIPLPPLEIQKQLVAEAEKEEEIITANRRLIEIMERKIEEVLSNI